jgi:hypothetical protein
MSIQTFAINFEEYLANLEAKIYLDLLRVAI